MDFAGRDGATPLDSLVAVCIHSYVEMLRQFDENPLVMSATQSEKLYESGQQHLETWATLRALSARIRKGRVPNRTLWMVLPKLHHLKHCIEDARSTYINPNMQNLLAAESWVGAIGRIGRKLVWNTGSFFHHVVPHEISNPHVVKTNIHHATM